MDILSLRKERGWTQQALADASGLSLRTIQRIERGETTPSQETLLALAATFDVRTEHEWFDLEIRRQQLAECLTVFCSTLEECFERMIFFARNNPDHYYEPDSFVRGGLGYRGWRDILSGHAFMISVEAFYSLPSHLQNRWQEEGFLIGDRISEGLDPWSDEDPQRGEKVTRKNLLKAQKHLEDTGQTPKGLSFEEFEQGVYSSICHKPQAS